MQLCLGGQVIGAAVERKPLFRANSHAYYCVLCVALPCFFLLSAVELVRQQAQQRQWQEPRNRTHLNW